MVRFRWWLVPGVVAAVIATSTREAHTSTFDSWQKSLPGMCVSVEITVGGSSDGGASEHRIVRETRAALDAVADRMKAATTR